MNPIAPSAVLYFAQDAYDLSDAKILGRQSAGHAFLRAVVAASKGQPVWACTPFQRSAQVFAQMVRALDPTADPRWVPADRLEMLRQIGTLYVPAPGLGEYARLRLRDNPGAYCLCGVTHTTASHAVMDAITGLLDAPVMPWDAVICTSLAVQRTVTMLIDAQIDYLHWRFGPTLEIAPPQFPVIPLGVHCADFQFDAAFRSSARQNLGISDSELVFLFVGRLSFHAKAHPHPMYLALQAAAERTGKKLTLLQAGWFANPEIEAAFKKGAQVTCPTVRTIFTDARDPEVRRQSWAAADVFISLSDNIQETFGLTPIEAMAANLPVVVTDWDGYRDTVRNGIDGFCIPTWMPTGAVGDRLALRHEAKLTNYDLYVGNACQLVSLDMRALVERLSDLISAPELRHRLGDAGRRRARESFDWSVIYRQYQALWQELSDIRKGSQQQPRQHWLQAAPKVAPSRMNPLRSFGHYPTALIEPTTLVSTCRTAQHQNYRALAASPMFAYATDILPPAVQVDELLQALSTQEQSLERLANNLQRDLSELITMVAALAKMGIVKLRASELV